ncbi:MAG: hypothetical protein ACP5H5_04135 [Pyrobaculum sp.]
MRITLLVSKRGIWDNNFFATGLFLLARLGGLLAVWREVVPAYDRFGTPVSVDLDTARNPRSG